MHWRNRFFYLISFITFSLSFNNICHFPANVYIYGTNFLISYTILMVFMGYPLHMMQVFLGQYCQQGLLRVFECAPICYGISFSMFFLSCLLSTYYNVLAAYSAFYFSKSFQSPLPWSTCLSEVSCSNDTMMARYYFYDVLLSNSSSTDNLQFTNIKWWIVLSNLYIWLLVYLATISGAKSIERFSLFVLTFSYFTILILFGVTLQIKELDHFNYLANVSTSIVNLEMWGVAAVQIVLELGLSYGVPICYGSYCHYCNFFHIDSLFVCAIDYFNSIICFIIFYKFISFNAARSSDLQWIIENDGLAMVYIVFSGTFAQLTSGNFYSLCFFLMLFLCVVTTQVGISETLLCAVFDLFPHLNRSLFNKLFCCVFFSLSLVFCFSNSFFDITILYNVVNFGGGLLIVFCFSLMFLAVFGLHNFFDGIENMLNKRWNSFAKLYFGWSFLFVSLSVIFFFSTWKLLKIEYPRTRFVVAWILFGLVPFLIIFLAVAKSIYYFVKQEKVFGPSKLWKRKRRIENNIEQKTKKYTGYFWSWYY